MRVADRIRKLSRDIIKAYVLHVKNKIDSGDLKYVNSGVDSSIDIYEALFLEVLRVTLGLERGKPLKFDHDLVMECVGVLDIMLIDNKHNRVTERYTNEVYASCELLFRNVEEGLRKNGYTL